MVGPGPKPLCHLPCKSCLAPLGLVSSTLSESLGPSSIGGSGSSPLIESWFWALLWQLQAGHAVSPCMDLGLHYSCNSRLSKSVRIYLWFRKLSVVGAAGEGCRWQLSVGEWSSSLRKGPRDRRQSCRASQMKRRFQKYKERMERKEARADFQDFAW